LVENLDAGYGKLQVLFGVSVSFPDASITAVVGPNGSGKSTLLKAIFGIAKVYRGRVLLDGEDLTKLPPHKRVFKGVVYMPQTENVFDNLTVAENLKMSGYTLRPKEFEERLEEALSIVPELRDFMKRKAKYLSGGEKQMLAIAMALMKRPKVVMLDEPTAGLAPKVARQVIDVVKKLKEIGLAVVLVEQSAKLALEVCDKAVLMVSGRVLFEGDPAQLLRSPDLGSTYLGLKAAERAS